MNYSRKFLGAAAAFIISFSLIGTGCSFYEPKVLPSFLLTNITEAEFAKVKAKNPKLTLTKQDIKKVFVDIDIKNTQDLEDIKVEIPDVNQIIDKHKQKKISANAEEVIYNPKKDSFITTKSFFFEYKGMSEDEVRKLLKDAKVKVSWREDGQLIVQTFELDRLIVPKEYNKYTSQDSY